MASLYGLHIEDPACRAVALAYCPWEEFLGMGRRYSSAIIPGFLDFGVTGAPTMKVRLRRR